MADADSEVVWGHKDNRGALALPYPPSQDFPGFNLDICIPLLFMFLCPDEISSPTNVHKSESINPCSRPINRTVTIDLSSRKAAIRRSLTMPLGVFHNTNWKICCQKVHLLSQEDLLPCQIWNCRASELQEFPKTEPLMGSLEKEVGWASWKVELLFSVCTLKLDWKTGHGDGCMTVLYMYTYLLHHV